MWGYWLTCLDCLVFCCYTSWSRIFRLCGLSSPFPAKSCKVLVCARYLRPLSIVSDLLTKDLCCRDFTQRTSVVEISTKGPLL